MASRYLAAAILALGFGGWAWEAAAGTVSFDFSGEGTANKLTFEQDGLGLSVQGLQVKRSMEWVGLTQSAGGIGIAGSKGSDSFIDNRGGYSEMLYFEFDDDIAGLDSAIFTSADKNDDFVLYAWDDTSTAKTAYGALKSNLKDGVSAFTFDEPLGGRYFALGTTGGNDDYRLQALTVSYGRGGGGTGTATAVPLPAGAVLLGGGLGGLALIGRWRKRRS